MASEVAESSGRKYRSKKQRPCDICRARKIHCHVPGNESTCECCKRLSRACTFNLEPLKRKRPPRADTTAPPDIRPPAMPASIAAPALHLGTHGLIPSGETPAPAPDSMALDMMDFWLHGDSNGFSPRGLSEFGGSQLLLPTPLQNTMSPQLPVQNIASIAPSSPPRQEAQMISTADTHTTDPASPKPFSLEGRKGYSNHLIGLSCESDPYLLRFYKYDRDDMYPMFRLDYRRMQGDINPSPGSPSGHASDSVPVQFVLTDEEVLKDGVKEAEHMFEGSSEKSHCTEEEDIARLHSLVSPDLGEKLIKLYIQCVHPRLPVLSLADLDKVRQPNGDLATPVGLLSAVYALAMPFTFLDDELSLFKGYLQVPTDDLWAISQRSYARASCLSHLSLLQLCLLLLQRPPYNYAVAAPPGFWALSCAAVSIAETLGVNLDPSSWRLPRHEIALRRRLWWLTYTQHVWYAIGLARPCHIHDSNWDVDELTDADLEPVEGMGVDYESEAAAESPIFLAHCRLSVIAADILKEFYTLQSTRRSSSLSILLSRAQPLRARIESWRQTLPLLSKPTAELTEDDLVIGASLRLAHLTLEILIFRALLRPLMHDVIPIENGVVPEPVATIHENCYACAKSGMEIVGSMKGKHFSTFWPSYVRYQLCYISNFVLLSLAQAPTHAIASRNKTLLHKWRDTLRAQARAWPLARLATIRLDAISWKGLPSVLSGAGSDSPAMQLLSEQDQRRT